MYPGYSPADHIYGEAAQEYGTEWAKVKKDDVEHKPDRNGPEYVVGQARIQKRKQVEEVRRKNSLDEGVKANGNNVSPRRGSTSEPNAATSNNDTPAAEDGNPYFVIDTNPTPVNIPDRTSGHKSKKVKTKHDSSTNDAPVVEEDDISAEVEARMKAKAEKREKKKDKKRKRETDDSTTLTENADASMADPVAVTKAMEKPKKKKVKKNEDAAAAEKSAAANGAADGSKKRSKKEKKEKKRATTDEIEDTPATNRGEADAEGGKKKKRKKNAEA